MSFYFGKECGKERKIRRDNGAASGALLSSLIKDNFLPISVSLEILSCVADILHEAKNLKSPHGDLQIDDICITNESTVYVNGFEQHNLGQNLQYLELQDVYALGIVMLSLLGRDINFTPPDRKASEDNYNMVIVEKLLSVDWQELKHQPWLSQIQEFLISMLQIEEQARPSALDITNVLLEVCNQCKGPTLLEYVQKNPEFFIALTPDYEELLQASAITAPIVEPLSFVPESSTGAATGLWPKEKIRELIQEDWSDEPIMKRPTGNQSSGRNQNNNRTQQSNASRDSWKKSDDFSLSDVRSVNFNREDFEPSVSPKGSSSKKVRDDSLRIVKTAFSPPEVPSETPKTPASLPGNRDRMSAPPVKDLAPTQSVPPITNIPSPNQQDTPYPRIISSSDYTPQKNPSSDDNRSLVEKITQHPQFLWFTLGGGLILITSFIIFIVLIIVIQRELSNHTVSVVEDNPNIVYEDMSEKEQDRISKYHDKYEDTGKKEDRNDSQRTRTTKVEENIEITEEIQEVEEVQEIKEVSPPKKQTKKTVKKQPSASKNSNSKTRSSKPSPKSENRRTTSPVRNNPSNQIVSGRNKFDVLFKLPQLEGKISCGDGQDVEFSQSISLSFTSQTACRIESDGAKGVFVANQKQIVECVDIGGKIRCN